LDFVSEKSKKSLVFAEIILELLVELGDVIPEESPIKGDMFLIMSLDPWRLSQITDTLANHVLD
jgi:hypothetical protein